MLTLDVAVDPIPQSNNSILALAVILVLILAAVVTVCVVLKKKKSKKADVIAPSQPEAPETDEEDN